MKDMKLIMEGWKDYTNTNLKEDADPRKLDPTRFPKELSKVSPDLSKITTRVGGRDGSEEDDKIGVEPVPFTAKQVKPSQSSMDINKAVNFVIQMLHPEGKLKVGGNLGAFISKDNYIMDGHHRWIATAMADPSAQLEGYQVNFPGEQLVAILNAMTKGLFGVPKGKAATGGFEQFNEQGILGVLQVMAQKGSWNNLNSQQVMEVLEGMTGMQGEGAVAAAAKKMAANLQGLTLAEPSWAPERPDMPGIDGDAAVKAARQALSTGQVDVNPPYAKTGKKYLDQPTQAAAE